MANRKHVDLKSLARAETETAVRVLRGIMTSAKAQEGPRVTAAVAILHMGWGKPPSSHKHVGGADGEDEIRVTIRTLIGDGK